MRSTDYIPRIRLQTKWNEQYSEFANCPALWADGSRRCKDD